MAGGFGSEAHRGECCGSAFENIQRNSFLRVRKCCFRCGAGIEGSGRYRCRAASVSCLQDFKAAKADVEGRGLKNTGGYIFYDGNNSLWLDPAKPSTREYVCALAKEIAELGFDELLLTDFSYPTVGKINKINYNTDVPLANNLDLLLVELNTALEPYDILLSIEVPETVIAEGPDTVAGLDVSRLAGRVDRIYAAVEPERVEALAELVTQAAGEDGKTEFVPELTADNPALTGSRLILAE